MLVSHVQYHDVLVDDKRIVHSLRRSIQWLILRITNACSALAAGQCWQCWQVNKCKCVRESDRPWQWACLLLLAWTALGSQYRVKPKIEISGRYSLELINANTTADIGCCSSASNAQGSCECVAPRLVFFLPSVLAMLSFGFALHCSMQPACSSSPQLQAPVPLPVPPFF